MTEMGEKAMSAAAAAASIFLLFM